jgi:hypothetical protein
MPDTVSVKEIITNIILIFNVHLLINRYNVKYLFVIYESKTKYML